MLLTQDSAVLRSHSERRRSLGEFGIVDPSIIGMYWYETARSGGMAWICGLSLKRLPSSSHLLGSLSVLQHLCMIQELGIVIQVLGPEHLQRRTCHLDPPPLVVPLKL